MGLAQYEEKRGTVLSGRKMHAKYEKTNKQYIPAGIEDATSIKETKLYSKKHSYVGIVDQAYAMKTHIVLVERKYSDYAVIWPNLRTQVGLLSILLEENYGIPVNECFFVFSKTKRVVKRMEINDAVRTEVLDMLRTTREMINTGIVPDAEPSAKCNHCCYKNVCSVGSLYTDK